ERDGATSPSRHVLDSMTAAIAHRGPDEHGVWVDGCVGLAARRLRVVDLVRGQQPLVNEDGSVRLVANGEIYNAGELRDDLRRKGHLFTTRTDIEVILHAYEDEGPACLERREGMFAFALGDSRRQRPVLPPDRRPRPGRSARRGGRPARASSTSCASRYAAGWFPTYPGGPSSLAASTRASSRPWPLPSRGAP